MTLEQVYAAIGGDYKGVMERLPSADFVRRFALKFLQDDSFPNLKKALEEKDAPTAFREIGRASCRERVSSPV